MVAVGKTKENKGEIKMVTREATELIQQVKEHV